MSLRQHAPCQVDSCGKLVTRSLPCEVCLAPYCNTHYFLDDHHCVYLSAAEYLSAASNTRKASENNLLTRVAASPIKSAAPFRPSATACWLRLPTHSQDDDPDVKGGVNLHIPIHFDDGGKPWLVRVKQQRPSSCSEPWLRLWTESEMATLKVLRQIAPEFITECWSPGCACPDTVVEPPLGPLKYDHLHYFFVEYADGESLDKLRPDATLSYLKQVAPFDTTIRDYASFLIKLSAVRFKGIGSFHHSSIHPTESNNAILAPAVGPLLNITTTTYPLGPFATNRERYTALLNDLRERAANRLWSDLNLNACLYAASLEAQEHVDQCEEMAQEEDTYITHGDLKPDIFRVRKDGSIAAILDWEFAYTAPFAEAFAPLIWYDDVPHQMLHDELVRQGRPDIAKAVLGGAKYHQLNFLLRGFMGAPLDFVRKLRRAILGSQAEEVPDTVDRWLAQIGERYPNDTRFQQLLAITEEDVPRGPPGCLLFFDKEDPVTIRDIVEQGLEGDHMRYSINEAEFDHAELERAKRQVATLEAKLQARAAHVDRAKVELARIEAAKPTNESTKSTVNDVVANTRVRNTESADQSSKIPCTVDVSHTASTKQAATPTTR